MANTYLKLEDLRTERPWANWNSRVDMDDQRIALTLGYTPYLEADEHQCGCGECETDGNGYVDDRFDSFATCPKPRETERWHQRPGNGNGGLPCFNNDGTATEELLWACHPFIESILPGKDGRFFFNGSEYPKEGFSQPMGQGLKDFFLHLLDSGRIGATDLYAYCSHCHKHMAGWRVGEQLADDKGNGWMHGLPDRDKYEECPGRRKPLVGAKEIAEGAE